MATLAFPPTASSFPSASTSNPGSPTFPHSQSLSLNGAGFALALRPGTSVGNRPLDIVPPSAALPEEPPSANGRTYLAFIKSWDDEHVGRWLYEVHVGQYADVFRTNDIRGDVLLDVDQQALKEMGVRSVGDRVKITVAIKALRQRCVKSTVSMPPRQPSYGSMASLASNGAPSSSAGATVGRRPGSGKASGRIPPPLHLSQSNTFLPQAWQPSTTPGSSRPNLSLNSFLLNAPTNGLTSASSPRSPGRNVPPPSLPPPRSQPPPAPSSRNSPPTTQSSLPRFGAPSISTTAASPTSSTFPANSSSSSSNGGTWPRSSSTSPVPSIERKMGSPQRPPTGVVPLRPSTGAQGKSSSTSTSPGRPSTTPGSYGHNQPLSTHPYATSTSPTSEGFSNTIYGRPIPASLPTKTPLTLLPSPPIANVPGADVYSTASTRPTTPGGMSSLDAVMRKAVKFIGDDGVSKMIAVADCTNGREVLVRVLRKFQVIGAGAGAGSGSGGEGDEGEGWGVYATNDGQVQRMLSEAELFAVCRDGQAPDRQRGLTLRRIKDFEATKRGRKLQWMFGVPSPPELTRPGGVSASSPTSLNYLGVGIPSTTIEPASPSPSTSSDFERAQSIASGDRRLKRASTISIMSSLGVDYPDHAQVPTHSPSSASFLSSGRKLRNFFGQRPPSELIATHLTEYFPKAEKNKLLSKQVRESMRKSIVRRDSQYSVVDTSWEKAPDRYSLNPSTQSRFSGSSGGSIRSSVQQASAMADRDYPTTPPRFGGARSQADNQSIRSSAPPSILEPPDESAEDDDEADTRSIAKSVASKSSRRSKSSRMSGWDGRSKDSDSASMITVDEVTAELETRRKSLVSYMSSEDDDEELPVEGEPGEVRPPSIEFSLEEEVDEEEDSEEDESESEESESEEEIPAQAVSSKPALKWIKGALIGAGSFGSVYLGMNPTSGSLMAVKQVELPTGNSHNEERKKSMLDALEREIELLKVLQHENIVQYLDSSSDATHLNIFLEYVPGGSVAALLSNYGAFEEALVSKFVRQILTGLEYLHEREIIHRDIKGANILVDNNGGIKISDFGISKKVEDNLLSTSKVHRPSLQGSVYWMAPEVVKQTAYTSKADIWSLGCLVVEMLTGVHPWANLTQMQAIFRIGSSAIPTIPDDVSSDAEDFLDQTFLIDYKERPPARELLQHAFIKEVDARTAEQQTPTRATFSQQNSPVKAEVAA